MTDCFCGLEPEIGETHTPKACVGPSHRITRAMLAERMDPHVNVDNLHDYLAGDLPWEALNSPEQAQVMDWRLRGETLR